MHEPVDGTFGRFLDVDLTTGTLDEYPIDPEWTRQFLGGRGIGARILLEELAPGVDPLGPENVLVFATGPLQGTGAAGAGRNVVMAKSPKTGAVSGSYVGGFFPHELGRSGYDGIIVRGAAETPQYLALTDGSADLRDAQDLWGEDVADVEETLIDRHDGGKVASIGIAGENETAFAAIINDRNRAAGRPGFGAVMGSKGLKAILARGDVDKPVHDEGWLRDAKGRFAKSLRDSGLVEWGQYGTSGGVGALDEMGILPTENFREGTFDEHEAISGETMAEDILTGRDNCTGCPVTCKRVVDTEFLGEDVEAAYGGPEYETLASFGSLVDNADLDAIALANQRCNRYGLDTISVGNAIAFLMEAAERDVVDTNIEWGDAAGIVDLVDQIAHREGVGDALADGVAAFADELGVDFDVTSKGQEVPMHEPRGKKGLGISYATSPRGGTHLEGFHDTGAGESPELGVDEVSDRFSLEGKPAAVATFENFTSFLNSAVLCSFVVRDSGEDYNGDLARELVNATTGLDLDADAMLDIGERNFALLKLLAAREGYSRADDGLPERFAEPLPAGASADEPITEAEMQAAIDEYYEARGWDETGPTEATLAELDMDAVAD
jgi:aldehyde:ferredoxin oxidoreductase